VVDPCLLVSADGPGFQARGQTACRLGHEIPRPGGERPDGVFGGWSWDGITLRADGDRYGLFPIYYFSTPQRFAISPSIPSLLALGPPLDLDDAALAVFLRLGFFLGEDTPFRSIRALPPGATIEWSVGRLQLAGGMPAWRMQPLSRDAAIDGFVDLFRTAMARRARPDEEVAVPLSGGRDSRHILLELCRAGRRPKFSVTLRHYPPTPDEDARIAGLVARRAGVPHVILPQVESRIDAEIRKNRITNFCADEHAWMLALGEYLPGRASHSYDGIGGDVLSAGLFLTAARLQRFDTGQFEVLAGELLRANEARTGELIAPEWAERLGHESAVRRLTAELARHAEAPNPVGSFFFWNRTRREIALASYRILNGGTEVLSPYLDHDLFDFLASLPASLMLDRQFHSETIRRAYPEYADIPFEDRGARPKWSAFHFRQCAAEVATWAQRGREARPAVQLAHCAGILGRARAGIAFGSSSRFDWRMTVFAVYLMQLSREMSQPA